MVYSRNFSKTISEVCPKYFFRGVDDTSLYFYILSCQNLGMNGVIRCIISVTQGELFAVSKYVKVTVILSSQSENTHANWLNIKYKLSKIV